METSLRTLAQFAANIDADNIPEKVLQAAAERVLDNISVGIAAANDALPQKITSKYLDLAGDGNEASIWGRDCKAPLLTAVFVNALMCHTLESDDVHAKSKAHIGATVVPAAWALAETLGCSGKELLVAVVAGYEVESRIAMALGVKEHRKLGWHVTATAGVFGAAAACGRLMNFDDNTMVSCLGLAGSQSFGSWAFLGDGTNSKVLNPARAATSGCEAAILASSGMYGPEHILEAKDGGLFRMMTSCTYIEHLTAGLGCEWEICNVDNKTYPCCRSTHCAIDCVLAMRERDKINHACVDRVIVSTFSIGKQQCGASKASLDPHNSVDAKFSTPYCVAAALVSGKISLDEFEQDMVESPDIQQLVKRVEVVADDRFTAVYPEHWGCHTTIICKDGSRFEMEVLDASGSVYSPLTRDKALMKAINMISRVLPTDAENIAENLLCICDSPSIPELRRVQQG